MSLNLKVEKQETLGETIGVPCSAEMLKDLRRLRNACGKTVNEKIREFIGQLIQENKDKLEKAG